MAVMVLITLLILGLALGSFVNALVWRLHQNTKSKSKKSHLSIVNGRSICTHCKHQLAAIDLIPIVSWLFLGGKCRYCHKPIGWQYPLVEALTAVLFVLSYIYWPTSFNGQGIALFVFWLAFVTGFMALAVYDLKWFILPDKITYKLLVLGVAQAIVILGFQPNFKQLTTITLSLLIGGGIFWALFQVSNGKWIGGGDVKLGFLLGLVLADGSLMVLTIFMASVLGTLVSVPLLVTGKATRTSRIPFGPFLIVATIIAKLFGASLIHWYRHKLLLSA